MTTRIMCMCAIFAALVSSPVMAQEEGIAAGPNTGAVSFNLGVDFTTAYYYRGIAQQNQGLIYQPYADVSFQLTDALSVYLGTWNSVHSNTGAGTDGQWYESDFFVGASFALSECLTADLSYIWLNAPANTTADEFAQEINLALSYDDSALWGDSFDGLQPHVLVAFETSGGSDGIGGGHSKGIYYELGIAPSFVVVDSASHPITLTVPVTLGLGSDYYEIGAGATLNDDTFGYVDAGLEFSMPLSCIPAQFGSWSVTTGVHFLFLGDNAEAMNSSAGTLGGLGIGGGNDFEVIGTFGIGMSY